MNTMLEEINMRAAVPGEDQAKMPRKKNDSLLKAAFEDCFMHLLRFFFRDADKIFDMSRGAGFMDKELLEITADRLRSGGTRTTDMLAKVYLLDGREQWILIHLEIQGESRDDFSYRMFEYYYRAADKFDRPIVAFAVFTGAADQKCPAEYAYNLLGTSLTYRYNIYHIFQHADQELLEWDNPFALIVLAAKKAHLEKKIPEGELNKERTIIARNMIASGKYTKQQIEDFVLFLKNILFIRNKEINANFDQEITKLTGGQINMPGIREAVAMIYREEAIKEGLKEGLREGLEKGLKDGLKEGLKEGIHQGEHKKAVEMAQQMLAEKEPLDKIVRYTKLSVDEIQTL